MAWELISETLILLCGGREQKEMASDLESRERLERKQTLDSKGTITPQTGYSDEPATVLWEFEACEQFVSGAMILF